MENVLYKQISVIDPNHYPICYLHWQCFFTRTYAKLPVIVTAYFPWPPWVTQHKQNQSYFVLHHPIWPMHLDFMSVTVGSLWGLHCKTLQMRILQKNDKFCSKLYLLVWTRTLVWTHKHTSLLQSPYITDP
jgi:hypothetical protein